MKFGVGQSLERKEDDALLRGRGRYVADYAPANLLHAVVLRSPHAHARFRISEIAKARAIPGVALVLTGADTTELGDLPCQGEVPDTMIDVPPYPILARDVVRHVGDAIAFVVADTIEHAKDAAEAIALEWEPLPHVIGAAAALRGDAPLVWPAMRTNLAFQTTLGDAQATAAAFAQAAHTVTLTVVNQRLVTNYLDTRGVIAEYDAGSRPVHADTRQPGQPRRTRRAVRHRAENSAGEDAGGDARCRRWFRHQAVSLSRICVGGGRCASASPSGEMGGRAQRAFSR